MWSEEEGRAMTPAEGVMWLAEKYGCACADREAAWLAEKYGCACDDIIKSVKFVVQEEMPHPSPEETAMTEAELRLLLQKAREVLQKAREEAERAEVRQGLGADACTRESRVAEPRSS